MLRFSLGTHRLQQQDNIRRRPFTRIKTWWHRFHDKLTAPTPDFGDLSPDRPPLPFIGSITESANQAVHRGISRTTNNITPLSGMEGALSASRPRAQASADRSGRQSNLYTIIEESETAKSESSMAPARSTFEEENKLKRLSYEGRASEEEQSGPTSSAVGPCQPPPFWRSQKNESAAFDLALVGNEDACRQQFTKMVQSVYNSHSGNHSPAPRNIEVVFDGQDNVEFIRCVINGRTEQHKFTGSTQFIPPEIVTTTTTTTSPSQDHHNSNLADVWVLGIHLYRMLVGKFPFAGSNDRKIFKKMLHAEFSVPQGYSEDVKDLLLRMLAPETTRASLDLVLYHAWLKPCNPTLPARPSPTSPLPISSTPTPDDDEHHVSPNIATTFPPPEADPLSSSPPLLVPPPPQSTQSKPKQRRFPRALGHAVVFLVKGPFPPPRRPYRDLGQPV